MKISIRSGCFETNSSSMHSLVVMKKDEHYTSEEIMRDIYIGKDGVLSLWGSDLEFERSPFRTIGTFIGKWKYACAALAQKYNDETYKELERIAYAYIPGLKTIRLPFTEHYIEKEKMTEKEFLHYLDEIEKECPGYELEYYWESGSGDCWVYEAPTTGYADGSRLSLFLRDNQISIEEFITNKKYIVIQDGDEYDYYGDMKEAGLINMEQIDHEYSL